MSWRKKQIPGGTILFREGDVADVAYILISGSIELSEQMQAQAPQIYTVSLGHAFGELCLFDPQALRHRTARALEDSVVFTVTPEEFQGMIAQSPEALQPFMQIAFERMRAVKTRSQAVLNVAQDAEAGTIRILPDSDKMRAQFSALEVATLRLPFRIGGYPEGGEPARRDQLHLQIAAQSPPLMVSRQHCEIVVDNRQLSVTDLGSRFCTTVNGVVIGRGHGVYNQLLSKGSNSIILGVGASPYRVTVECD